MIFTIEINNENNGGHFWSPTGEALRGRWDFGRTAHRNISQDAEGMKQLARIVRLIPGMFVQVDIESWTGRIFDPMNETEEGREQLAKIKQVYKQNESEFGTEDFGLAKTREFQFDTADELKEWTFRMAQAVAAKNATVVDGSEDMPSPEQIAKTMPGGLLNNPGIEIETKPKPDPNDARPLKMRDQVKVPANYKPVREEEASAASEG